MVLCLTALPAVVGVMPGIESLQPAWQAYGLLLINQLGD